MGELAEPFAISRPAISKHLRLLQQAGLVEAHTHGTRSVYTVRLEGFASVRDFVDAFWDAALQRLAALARDDVARKDHS